MLASGESWKEVIRTEIYAIIAVARKFGYKRGNLSGLNSVRRLPKTAF